MQDRATGASATSSRSKAAQGGFDVVEVDRTETARMIERVEHVEHVRGIDAELRGRPLDRGG